MAMSSTPPPTPSFTFKRAKAKPATRTRQSSPDRDNENADATTVSADDSPATLATKLKNKVKKSKPKSRLSFGGDDDEEGEEVFKVKKSSLSRKVALGKHPATLPSTLDQVTISTNRGPTYDKAYLNELKASTPSTRPPASPGDPYDADMSIDIDDPSMDIDPADLIESVIPSESSIKVAKERRERVRKTGGSIEEEYISLSVVKRDQDSEGPHPESRLMREEDDLGDGDDEFAEYTSAQERIALGKKARKVEAGKRRDTMKEMIEDAEEQDDETLEWEQEQLRRGGHRTPEPSSAVVKQIYKPASIPIATSIPTLPPVLTRLTQQLSQLTTSHTSNVAALEANAKERDEVDQREAEMREMVGRAEEKRAWFESFKDWLEAVAGFLDEKYPLLEELENEQVSLLEERFNLVSTRRREDDEDDLSDFLGLPQPSSAPSEPETDEAGNPIPRLTKTQRRASRRYRHQVRLQNSAKEVEEEGYSTDSDLAAPDALSYSAAQKALASRTQDVLADVKAEEFRDPGKGRWAMWREKFTESYVGAWGGLGVVSVWEFWVRLELVGWNCIEDSRSLDAFKWYQGLYEYSRPGEGVLEEREVGPDGDLVTSMITTAVIPRMCTILEAGALDVYSSKHIRRIVDLAEEIESTLGNDHIKFQALLKSVATAFQTTVKVGEDVHQKFASASGRPAPFNPEAIPARRRYLARRVKLLKNVLRWRKYTGERYGLGLLVGRLIEGSILNVAETGWDVGGQDMAKKVAELTPDELKPPQLRRKFARG